jgi:PAS domain S-box-containing protein
LRYSVAAGVTAATLPLSLWLTDLVGHDFPVVLFALPVMVSAYWGGLGPGLLATFLVTLLGEYIVSEPHFSLKLAQHGDQLRLAIVAVVGVLISLLSEGLHRARRQSEQAAAAIAESRRHIDEVLASITDAFFAMDRAWRIVEINERAAAYFGVQVEAMRGREFWEVCPQCQASPLELRLRQVQVEKTPAHFEMPSCGFPGRWAEIHAYPSDNGLNVYFRDISQRKCMERKLQLAKEAAEGANRTKDQFLAALSHELRTPLMPVLMSAEALAADLSLPPPVRGELEMIRRNVEVEKRLIDDLLDLTRIARGKMQLNCQATDVHQVIQHALSAVKEEIRGKSLQLTADLRAAERLVWGDSGRLQQVFSNLLKNAAKFTPTGGSIAVRTRNSPEGKVLSPECGHRDSELGTQHSALIVEVSDTGIGIEPQLLPRLFHPFEQGGTDMTQRFGGLGLGLAICKTLVDLHQGTIGVSSAGRDKGATFRVELPTVPAPAAAPPPAPEGAPTLGRRLRILLVEDHPSTANVLARLLRLLEHQVEVADSVGSALALASEGHFDLIISDLGLPDGSGLDLMRRLQSMSPTPGIALSGYGMEEDLKRSHEAGFAEHLIKPVSMKVMERAIARLAGEGKNASDDRSSG